MKPRSFRPVLLALITGALSSICPSPVGAAPSADAVALTLASGSRSQYTIVTAPTAPRSVKLAGEELKHYLREATGANLAIAAAVEGGVAGPVISLGDTAAAKAAGLTAAGLPPEGYRIVARGGNLYILGPDTADDALAPGGGTSTGTLNGVYAFLEDHVGVRWLMPGSGGDDVPRRDELTVRPDLDVAAGPAFASRLLPYIGKGAAVDEWSRRLRLGGTLKIAHSHNWQQTVPPTLFAEHPDWFAEVNGVRVPPVGRYKLETTNPQLVAFYAARCVEAFRARPTLACFSLSPSDSAGWSRSEASKALYEVDPNGKLSVSRLILTFYNDVARIVRKEVPDRLVAGYVYADYLYPPKGDVGPIEPNLFLVCAVSPDYGYTLYRPDVRRTFDETLSGWSRRTRQLGYYDLPTNLVSAGGAPTATGRDILKFIFSRLPQYGVKQVYMSGTANWGAGGLGNYLKAKLMWDPKADVAALADEYLMRAYGPAAGPVMIELDAALDDATRQHYQKDKRASYTMTPEVLRGIYSDRYATLEAKFVAAKAAAASPAQSARLAMYEKGLILLNANLRRAGMLPAAERSPLYRTDEQIDQLLADPATALATGAGPADAAGQGKALRVRLADPAPPAPTAPPKSMPYLVRGPTRTLLHVDRDEEVRVTFVAVPKSAQRIPYVVHDLLGRKIASGAIQQDGVVKFAGNQGQTYVMEIEGRSPAYAFRVDGCRYAVRSASAEHNGIHLLSRTTPLYVYVPPGAAANSVAVILSSASPGETAAADVLSPTGELTGSLDTSKQPAVRFVLPVKPGAEAVESGFWIVRFKKPAAGAVDDVYLDVSGPASPWFGVEPEHLLAADATE